MKVIKGWFQIEKGHSLRFVTLVMVSHCDTKLLNTDILYLYWLSIDMWWNVRCFPPASAFSFFCFTHRWRLICMFSTFVLSLKLERFLSTWFFSLNTCHCVFGATNNGAAFLSNGSCWNPEAWMDANMISMTERPYPNTELARWKRRSLAFVNFQCHVSSQY